MYRLGQRMGCTTSFFFNLSCIQTYYFTYFLNTFFFSLPLFSFPFSLWFIGLLHRFFLLCVCFWSNSYKCTVCNVNAQPYNYDTQYAPVKPSSPAFPTYQCWWGSAFIWLVGSWTRRLHITRLEFFVWLRKPARKPGPLSRMDSRQNGIRDPIVYTDGSVMKDQSGWSFTVRPGVAPSMRVSGRVVVVVVVVRRLFFRDVSDLCADQRSEVRGYEDCLPHDSRFSSTAVFSPQWIRRDHFTLFCYVNIKLLLFFVD